MHRLSSLDINPPPLQKLRPIRRSAQRRTNLTRKIVPLVHGDVVMLSTQRHGRSETAEAGTDNSDV
jgi:hypothetical protein